MVSMYVADAHKHLSLCQVWQTSFIRRDESGESESSFFFGRDERDSATVYPDIDNRADRN